MRAAGVKREFRPQPPSPWGVMHPRDERGPYAYGGSALIMQELYGVVRPSPAQRAPGLGRQLPAPQHVRTCSTGSMATGQWGAPQGLDVRAWPIAACVRALAAPTHRRAVIAR